MRRFTDSHYERLMTQVPTGRKGTPPPFRPAFGPSLRGCPYGKGTLCIGVCLRELLRKQNESDSI